MAISFTISYTFSPNTTIQSSQVNTNFSDESNVWNGLEALTKTFAKLKVDVDPATALEVATKQYVDHYSTYRRPVLQYNSTTVVNIETGIDGTSGDCRILFPDGNLRTDTSTSRIQCNLAQVAALSGSAQSGLRTGSVAVSTWYAIYAVKTSDNSSNFVAVADTVLPIQSNFATLNSNFGTNSWVYLGLIRNGDNSGSTNVILKFVQAGHTTIFYNATNLTSAPPGTLLINTGGATSVSYSYSAGTGATGIPNNISLVKYTGTANTDTGIQSFTDSGSNYTHFTLYKNAAVGLGETWAIATDGARQATTGSVAQAITLSGFVDGALGVGSNPIL